MDDERSLRHQWGMHQAQIARSNRKTGKMLGTILGLFLAITYVVMRIYLWRVATGSHTGFLARSLEGHSWGLALQGLVLQNDIRVVSLNLFFMRIVVPFCFVTAGVLFVASEAMRRITLRFFRHPVLVRQLMVFDRAALATHDEFIKWEAIALGFLVPFCLAGALLLPSSIATKFLFFAIFVLFSVILVGGIQWIRNAERSLLHRDPVSLAYTKTCCLTGVLRQCVLLSSVVVLAGSALLLTTYFAHGVANILAEKSHDVAQWKESISAFEGTELEVIVLNDLRAQVETLFERLEELESMIKGMLLKNVIDFLAILFFIACAVACMDIGLTLARYEYRQPLFGLAMGLLAALGLSLIELALNDLLPHSGGSWYATTFGTLLLVFVLGQLSALMIRMWTVQGNECPACLHKSNDERRCPMCGLRFNRAQDAEFVANSISGELHVKSCHHLTRIPEESQRAFSTLSDALWEGYDLCGSCLGGSLCELDKS